MRAARRCEAALVGPVALGAGLVLLWQLLVGAGALDPFYFSRQAPSPPGSGTGWPMAASGDTSR